MATRETDATNKRSPWIPIAAAHVRVQHWPNKCNAVVHSLEQKKRWMMVKTMFDENQTSFNNFQHHATWWRGECNMFDSTMLDDVTLTCSVDPFGQALTARNVIEDESQKKK